MSIEIHHGDGLLAMDGMADASVDCIVTDPPYWTLDKWRAVGTTTRLGGGAKGDSDPDKWFQTITAEDLWDFVCHTWRVLKPNRHAWVMCDHETLPSLVGFARECSPEPFDYVKSYPVVKLTADGRGIKAGMGYHGRASHEYVVLLEKGRRRFNEENWPDVFQYPWTGATETAQYTPDHKPYPTAKPVALFRRLVELSTTPGELCLDPFAGSGTLGAACRQCDRNAVLYDTSERAVAVMRQRMAEYSLAFDR